MKCSTDEPLVVVMDVEYEHVTLQNQREQGLAESDIQTSSGYAIIE